MNSTPLRDFPFQIVEPAGLARTNEPVRLGLPMPRGAVPDLAALRLEDEAGQAVPMQARALAHWSDGSVQWALLDILATVPSGGRQRLRLTSGLPFGGGVVLRVVESTDSIEVDTGLALFRVPRHGDALLASVRMRGVEQLSAPGLRIVFRDGRGTPRSARVRAIRIEEKGALRAAVVVEGHIAGTGWRHPVELLARLMFAAGSGVVEAEFRLRNPRRARHRGGLWDLGDPGSQLIRELALVLEPATAPAAVRWRAATNVVQEEADALDSWTIYQDSSGGDRWNSPNHLGADGKLTVSFPGYQVRGASGAVLATGDRATPNVEVVAEGMAIACAVEDFWQNFPKALRVVDGRLEIALFPAEARVPVELQGGEQKRHRLWLAFGAPGEAAAQVACRLQPLQVLLDPLAAEATRAIRGFAAPRASDDPRYVAYMRTIIEGEHSFFSGREAIDEYGWRNFGDVYADHEAVRHDGAEPFISHYNNQYDVVLGTLLHGLRNGDIRWMELAKDLARHVIDIDIYHAWDDKPAYSGGLFWHSDHYLPAGLATHRTYSRVNARGSYGGGPDNEQNYTTGLLMWYFLSGDPDAAEAVCTLAQFVMAMDDGSRTIFRFFDRGPTGNATKTVSMDYHGPGRGAGNSINALLDAFWLTRERRYLEKVEQLVSRCIHPQDDIPKLQLDEPEHRWSYLVFLQVLGKYLDLKVELGETEREFQYARESLLHYARWMLEHERPYKEQLHKVLLPTETWPAQDVRKAQVFAAAARYCIDAGQRDDFRAAAAMYATRCLSDLQEFPTAHLVRPRVLLAVNGMNAGTSSIAADVSPIRDLGEFAAPSGFVPQRRRVMERLRRLLRPG